MTTTIDKLNQQSLSELRQFFSSLQPPTPDSLHGLYRGFFVGPGWLTPLWPPTLALTGLGGWWGKDFDADGQAINLVQRKGAYERRFPMSLVEETSYLDGKPGLALHYQPGCPFPWPHIVDELRRIDEEHVLGMTLAAIGPLRRQGFPFVLQSRDTLEFKEIKD